MKNYCFWSMSTMIHIEVSDTISDEKMEEVKELFYQTEQMCSRFLKESELSRLNERLEVQQSVSPILYRILSEALHQYEETSGLFNPGMLSYLEYAGYTESIEKIRNQEVNPISTMSLPIVSKPYTLNPHNHSVILHTKIDLGGIVKGWVVDQSVELLGDGGYGFVNAGGDLRLFGDMLERISIGIENPFEKEKLVGSLSLKEGAVATSTLMKRKWKRNGKWQHHLIDPRTSKPLNTSLVSCTVTAPTAVEADIWAKIMLLLGEDKDALWIKLKNQMAVYINQDQSVWEV